MSIKVSVIVPCYNVEKYVEQCVKSICSQTLKEIEIICVNDGSKDNTLLILEELRIKDKRIRIINKENSGYGHSVNIGMKNAKGKYVGIIESDDFIDEEMYEHLYYISERNDLSVARCNFYEYHTSDGSNHKRDFAFVPKYKVFCPIDENMSVFWQQPTVWVNLYKREWLEKNNISFLETPGASYQDISFSFKVYCKAKRFMMISDAYHHYRVDNTESSINSKGKVFCVCDEWDEIKRFLEQNPEIYEKVKYIVSSVQFGNYRWNYNRLGSPERFYFLEKWTGELREYIRNKELKWSHFSKRERKHLFIIAYIPFLYKLGIKSI